MSTRSLYTHVSARWTVILAFLTAVAAFVAATPSSVSAGGGISAQIFITGNAPDGTCQAILHGQIGDCSVIVHSGLSAGDSVTLRVWSDAGMTTLLQEDSVTSPGGLTFLGSGGVSPGDYVELVTPGSTYVATAPEHSVTIDAVNDTVSGVTPMGGQTIQLIPYAAVTDESTPFACTREPGNDGAGAWATDYTTTTDVLTDDPPGCTVTTWDIQPGDWFMVNADGGVSWAGFVIAMQVPLFNDVDRTSTHAENISQMALEGITLGCDANGNFCPDDGVRRDQMASFLDRASENSGLYALLGGGGFLDVTPGSTHAAAINDVAAAGITLGCNADGTLFCPADLVTREQMATFLARALGLTPSADNRFGDVVSGSTHAGNINAVAEAGITLGCNADGTLFCPRDVVSRQQMASFIVRSLNSS